MNSSRPGDWRCPVCNNLNYASRIECNKPMCRAPKPPGLGGMAGSVLTAMAMQQPTVAVPTSIFDVQQPQAQVAGMVAALQMQGPKNRSQPGDAKNWICPVCQNDNFPHRVVCNKPGCNFPRPHDPNGNWLCQVCGNDNYPNRTHCNNKVCGVPRPPFTSGFATVPMTYENQILQQQVQMAQAMGYSPQVIAQLQQQFAVANATKKSMARRPGDWICPKCANLNYASRETCNKPGCLQPKAESMRWVCPKCSNDNYPERTVCNRCAEPKPLSPQLVVDSSELQLHRKRSQPGDPDNWICPECQNENFPSRMNCNNKTCRAPRATTVEGLMMKRQKVI